MTLEEKIKNLIEKDGPVTFARFMEMALFDPEEGYYTRGKAAEDYYTSPAAHPAFGALIALQLEQMWEIMERPHNFTVVEMGAGRGLLAEDILDFISKWSSALYRSIRYISIERGGQLADNKYSGKCQFIKSNGLPLKAITGCLLSNELVDSFPVHRVVKRDGKIREIFVGFEDGKFTEVIGELSSNKLKQYLTEQGIEIEEGQKIEVNLEALKWIHTVYGSLKSGYVITVDYGHEAGQLYSQRFFQGALICYYKHNYNDNPYIRVGQQDITSHINFTALLNEAEKLGLKTCGLTTQARFLRNLGLDIFLKALVKMRLPQREYYANQMAMHNLVSPEGIGDFKVLIQSKNVKADSLYCFTPDNDLIKKIMDKDIPVPLLKPRHLSLLQASYPAYYFKS